MLFGEDSKSQPDDFFGLLTEFLETFSNAKKDNEVSKKKKEDEERRKRMEQDVSLYICSYEMLTS